MCRLLSIDHLVNTLLYNGGKIDTLKHTWLLIYYFAKNTMNE